jgi:hypothetical protein
MDEKTTNDQQSSAGANASAGQGSSTGQGTGPSEHAGSARDRKEFEERLDGFADKFSHAMSDGVKRLEEAFDRGKENLRQDMDSQESGLSGSPRLGMILVGLGILWLLYALGVLSQPIFPVLLIVLGIYFLLRNR